MKMKAIVTSLASVTLLYGCNSGNSATTPQPTTTPDAVHESMVPNPMLINFDARKKSSVKSDVDNEDNATEIISINKSVRIGYGYFPETGQAVMIRTDPMALVYDSDGKGKPKSIFIPEPCAYNDYGKIIGDMTANTTNDIFGSKFGFGLNIGLAKANAAAGFNLDKLNTMNTYDVTKMFGASTKCHIGTLGDSLATSDGDRHDLGNMAAALLNASSDLRKAIADIRLAKTLDERQTAISRFYREFGTHTVVSVDVGEVAVKKIVLSQKTKSDQTTVTTGASADFEVPFVNGSAEVKYGKTQRFESKNWETSIFNGDFPSGTEMRTSLDAVVSELNKLQNSGIIKFDDLVPTPYVPKSIANISLPPDISPTYLSQYNTIKANFASLDSKITTINKSRATIAGLEMTKASSFTITKTQAKTISSNMTSAIEAYQLISRPENISYLYFSNSTKFKTTYSPQIKKWIENGLANEYTKLASLAEKAAASGATNADKAAVNSELALIKLIEAAAKGDVVAEQQMFDANIANESAVAATKVVDGSTFSAYLFEFQFYKNSENKIAYDKLIGDDAAAYYKKWYDENKSAHMVDWKVAYKAKYPQYLPDQFVPQSSIKPEQPLVKNSVDAFDPYAGKGVLNFEVRQWVDIFPELSQTFGIDDSPEMITNDALSLLNEFNNYYLYLSKMTARDNQLFPLLNATRATYNQLGSANGLRGQILNSTQTNTPSVQFQKITYDLSNAGRAEELRQVVEKMINDSALYKSEWFKVSKTLFDKKLLGNYGSFVGIQPQGQEYYSLINNSTINARGDNISMAPIEPFPSPLVVNDPANENPDTKNAYINYSPFRLIAQGIVKFAQDALKGRDIVPTGVMQGTLREPGLDDNTYSDKYSTKAARPGILALNGIPSNSPAEVLGVLPAVLAKTRISTDGKSIENLGLLDAKGNIWGANAGGTTSGSLFTDDTVTYTLSIDSFTQSTAAPAYKITSDSGKVTEFQWSSGSGRPDMYNKFIVGVGLDADKFLPKFTGKSTNNGNESFFTFTKHNDGYNSVYLSSNLKGGKYISDSSKVLQAWSFLGANSDSSYLYEKRWNDNEHNLYDRLKTNRYTLVLSPIDSNALTTMGGKIKVQATPQQPLLPRFLNYVK